MSQDGNYLKCTDDPFSRYMKAPMTKGTTLFISNSGRWSAIALKCVNRNNHINAHGLPPTTKNESLDMSLAGNSFQIKSSKKNLRINFYSVLMALVVMISVVSLLLPGRAVAEEENLTVGIFPFEINGPTTMAYLESRIPEIIKNHLTLEGARAVVLDQNTLAKLPGRPDEIDHKTLQNLGLEQGLDYLVWGGLFTAGGEMSVDIRLFNVLQRKAPLPFFGKAAAVENLFAAVTALCKEISSEMFQRQMIASVGVKGNRRIESDAVLKVLDVKSGDIFKPSMLSKDLKRVFEMGYFEDVRIESEKSDKGVDLFFLVAEKPSVRKIKYLGNHIFEDQEIADVVHTGTGSILNIYKINEDIQRIKSLYTEKNYHNSKVTYTTEPLENNQADIVFTITEGKKLKVEKIIFEGNRFFFRKRYSEGDGDR